jgi:hypothetical protein
VVADGSSQVALAFSEILTAERMRNRRGLRFHLREREPLVVAIRRRDLWTAEDRLIANGVRVVDWLGAILTHTLSDFDDALDQEPGRVRQSSDDA